MNKEKDPVYQYDNVKLGKLCIWIYLINCRSWRASSRRYRCTQNLAKTLLQICKWM